jgi:hypothetical protein
VKLFDKSLERNVLMLLRRYYILPDSSYQFRETRFCAQVGRYYQCVDEETNETFYFSPVAAGDRGTDSEQLLSSVAV